MMMNMFSYFLAIAQFNITGYHEQVHISNIHVECSFDFVLSYRVCGISISICNAIIYASVIKSSIQFY